MTNEINNDIKTYDDLAFKSLKYPAAQFHDLDFSGCSFRDCDFTGASFTGCQFSECTFSNCNVTLLCLTDSLFAQLRFSGCKMLGINWTQARRAALAAASPIHFENCVLNDSSFQGMHVPEMTLLSCKARDVDFREANLSKANCMGTDFTNSLFMHSNLEQANFAQATQYTIDVRHNAVEGAIFDRYEAVRLLQGIGIEIVD